MTKQNIKLKSLPQKKASHYNQQANNPIAADCKTIIRLGIHTADELAKDELRKRKLQAPLTIEEKLFISK